MLACSIGNIVEAADVDCPGPGEAFVTSCSGSEPTPAGAEDFDEEELVDEVLKGAKEKKPYNSVPKAKENNNDSDEGPTAAIQQLKQTSQKMIQRYYDPLPRQGKCAIGTICGFTASRLSLGVANRIFRLAGATWVLSEVLHTTGFCDEAKCMPEEARPWVGILTKALRRQCVKVRMFARQIWDQDRIRAIADKDEMVAGGFAAGAFVGFVV